jgi:hypothetical protein
VKLGASIDQLDDGVPIGEHRTGMHSHRRVRQLTATCEIRRHRLAAAMVTRDRTRARDMPDDVLGEELQDRSNRTSDVHLALAAVKLGDELDVA